MKGIAAIWMGMALSATAYGVELPICEEFAGETNVRCVSSGETAVITSVSATGRSYEFYAGGRKAYLELSEDGSITASSGVRILDLPEIPGDSTERYVGEVLEALLDDIAWK